MQRMQTRTSDNARKVIKTPDTDTDVVVLDLYYFPEMKHVSGFWIETGRVTKTADQRRFILIHNISKFLGLLFCLVFLGYMPLQVVILPQHCLEKERSQC